MTSGNAEQLYLRGDFNLWGFQEQYRLQKVTGNLYSAAVRLEAEQNYAFMFSAKDASTEHGNCGYRQVEDQRLVVGKTVNATCHGVVLQSFEFRPVVPGTYEFFIDFPQTNKPRVFVKKAY